MTRRPSHLERHLRRTVGGVEPRFGRGLAYGLPVSLALWALIVLAFAALT